MSWSFDWEDCTPTEYTVKRFFDEDWLYPCNNSGEVKLLRRPGSLHHGGHFIDLPPMTRIDATRQNGNHGNHNLNGGFSARDLQRPRPSAAVSRSQSFAGMAHRPKEGGAPSSPNIVLGESFRHHRSPTALPSHVKASTGARSQPSFNYKKSPKVPKVPRPNRALLMFQSVKKGIKEFIDATKEDITQLQMRESDGTSTAQGRAHETDKQIKSAERYLKRLEFHLAKLDELHEFYLLQQQLREGVRTMHKAYVTSPGNQRDTLANVKYGYKECTQTMCNIEAQLEVMMGTFNCKLKGMAGFARLCPGDVFEVTVRHGTQKWKTRGRVEKTGNQRWDIPEFTFKAVVGDIINIKGVEVRSFKSIVLGQKSCETKDLFSANPQLMTVSINVNGSLKLSFVITWNPLDGVDDNVTFLEAPLRSQSTPRRRPVSVIALNGQYDEEDGLSERRFSSPVSMQQTKDDNFILRTQSPRGHNSVHQPSYDGTPVRHSEYFPSGFQISRQTTSPNRSETGLQSFPEEVANGGSSSLHHTNDYINVSVSDASKQSVLLSSSVPTSVFSSNMALPAPTPTGEYGAVTKDTMDSSRLALTLEEAVQVLSSSLEDYHGQYVELQKMEDLVSSLERLLRKQSNGSSRSSSISVSIEDALEAFDFLNIEDSTEEPSTPVHKKSGFDDMLCSPESTAKTGDSGIESLAQRLSEDTQLGSSLGSSPVPSSTGNDQVDTCLIFHLNYCERLLENLGVFGPLKCKEIYALDKLQKQSELIDSLLQVARSGSEVNLLAVMTDICDDKSLREFWAKCTDHNVLYIDADRLQSHLEQRFGGMITEGYLLEPHTVCKHLVAQILDVTDIEMERSRTKPHVTLHQFMLYFKENGGTRQVEAVAAEIRLIEKLTSGKPDVTVKAIQNLRDLIPSAPCLKVLSTLLLGTSSELRDAAGTYLNLVLKKADSREKALVAYVEGLEDKMADIRCGSCAALSILEATESIDQLAFVCQSDSHPKIKQKAKEALLAMGEEGRKAFEETQLSSHGFQGIQVHK